MGQLVGEKLPPIRPLRGGTTQHSDAEFIPCVLGGVHGMMRLKSLSRFCFLIFLDRVLDKRQSC